jgi:biopolymer transport protein ExbB
MPDAITSLIAQGGIFMIPLLMASVLSLAVVLERLVFYLRLESGREGFRRTLLGYLQAGKRNEALTWLASLRGPIPATVKAGLEKWDEGSAAVEAAMAARARKEVPSLRHLLPILDTTYSGAPLVGLLGTITGMMGVFRVVAQRLSQNPNADTSGITVGIGEALIATATGILIAVVCLIFHNLFQSWMDDQMDTCEAAAADVLEVLGEKCAPTLSSREGVM